MAKSSLIRKLSAGLCITPAIISVLVFNLFQEPAFSILFGDFLLKDIFYLSIVTIAVIIGSVLINTIVYRLIEGTSACPAANNPRISWEHSLFVSSAMYYSLTLKNFVSPELYSTVVSFATSFPTAILFGIGILALWIVLLRFLENQSKTFEKFLNKLEIVTSNEPIRLIVLSGITGVTLRILIDTVLVFYGFNVPLFVTTF